MSDKELVTQFFMEGYQNKNYGFILKCLSEDYIDHSPAGARSNQEAVNILMAVSKMFSDMQITIADIFLRMEWLLQEYYIKLFIQENVWGLRQLVGVFLLKRLKTLKL